MIHAAIASQKPETHSSLQALQQRVPAQASASAKNVRCSRFGVKGSKLKRFGVSGIGSGTRVKVRVQDLQLLPLEGV